MCNLTTMEEHKKQITEKLEHMNGKKRPFRCIARDSTAITELNSEVTIVIVSYSGSHWELLMICWCDMLFTLWGSVQRNTAELFVTGKYHSLEWNLLFIMRKYRSWKHNLLALSTPCTSHTHTHTYILPKIKKNLIIRQNFILEFLFSPLNTQRFRKVLEEWEGETQILLLRHENNTVRL